MIEQAIKHWFWQQPHWFWQHWGEFGVRSLRWVHDKS